MKYVYIKYIKSFIFYLGLLILIILRHLFMDAAADTLYTIYLAALAVFVYMEARNRVIIEKNEDEMVRHINARIDARILSLTNIFLCIAACLLLGWEHFGILPMGRQALVTFIFAFLTIMALLRIMLFKYYDGKACDGKEI